MTIDRRKFLLAAPALLAACSGRQLLSYNGPKVTSIMAFKQQRKMYLLHGNKALKSYPFQLGFTPVGHKQFEGDGKTPEGTYIIDRRNPNSSYHLSVGISYPNDRDRAFAEAHGKRPGGDIFIHGTPSDVLGKKDWTAGCIAVTNEEVEEIYAMVGDYTPVFVKA
ncbi:murein L,D-transpeptidase YafK [Limimaricola variabilis]|uniref:Murein L,D-transpeptidase YafK n=1 Tax=Limimaricola variabilis TaxID=1492771 RepID=A0ABR6HLR3_9RHOB|nr:L,D-transpeptidase family protein [Limimaricola variabilis]MBB3711380.1 murein L,D-transpeptidase YafK [Limimaricola variabilis]WPY93645.1 L,D-transpeptidase family protein [Limimaricola variabilis]